MINSPNERRSARLNENEILSRQIQRRGSSRTKAPITVELIVETALHIVKANGYDALSMRAIATKLETGPASLYAHVVNKSDLNELLLGYLSKQVTIPAPDRAHWKEQVLEVSSRIRDQYLEYPGISKAAYAAAPTDLEIMRMSEGLFSLFLEGGVAPQTAAWTLDALILYINAYCQELSIVHELPGHTPGEWVKDRAALLNQFKNLPDTFKNTKQYANELTSGQGHDRFVFTIQQLLSSL